MHTTVHTSKFPVCENVHGDENVSNSTLYSILFLRTSLITIIIKHVICNMPISVFSYNNNNNNKLAKNLLAFRLLA